MKTHSISYNFIMNMILKMSAFIFPLITFPYVSRVLGADGNGKVLFATSLISYFSMFASLGIPTYGIKACAWCREDREKLSRTVQELTIISLVMTCISYLALVLAVVCIPKLAENKNVIMVYSVAIILNSMGMEWFYQAIEQYDYIAYRKILFKFISIILMFLLVKDATDYVWYAGVTVIGTAGSNVLNVIRIRKYIHVRPVGNYDFQQHLKPILILFLLSVSTVIYTNLDAVMLGFMKPDTEVGYYNAAIKMKGILVGIVTSLGAVLLPRISHYLKNQQEEQFNRVVRKSFQFVIMLALSLSVYFVVEARDTILFLAGEEFEPAVAAMRLITPTIIFIGLTNVMGIQVLIPMNKESQTVLSTVCGAVVDVVLNLAFIPRWGAAGAALSTLIAEVVVLVVQAFCLKSYMKKWCDGKDFLKVCIVTAVATVGMLLMKKIVAPSGAFASLVLTAFVFWGIVACGLVLLKEEIVDQYLISRIIGKIARKR